MGLTRPCRRLRSCGHAERAARAPFPCWVRSARGARWCPCPPAGPLVTPRLLGEFSPRRIQWDTGSRRPELAHPHRQHRPGCSTGHKHWPERQSSDRGAHHERESDGQWRGGPTRRPNRVPLRRRPRCFRRRLTSPPRIQPAIDLQRFVPGRRHRRWFRQPRGLQQPVRGGLQVRSRVTRLTSTGWEHARSWPHNKANSRYSAGTNSMSFTVGKPRRQSASAPHRATPRTNGAPYTVHATARAVPWPSQRTLRASRAASARRGL